MPLKSERSKSSRKSENMKRLYGYIRVSPKEQGENSYLKKLLEAGVPDNQIFSDRVSNTNSDCTAFRRLIKKLNPGDMVFVATLDHLGKNCDEVKDHWKIITKDRGCDLAVLDTPVLDTCLGENVKDIVIESFGAFSRIKRNYAHQRQAEGIAVAKVNDAAFGRPTKPIPDNFPAVADMYEKKLVLSRVAAERLNVAPSTFLKWYRNESI